MEIVERLPLKPIHWLSKMTYTEFVEKCLNKDKKYTKEECKTKYSILQQFCKTNLKTGGTVKRIYSYSSGTSGRLFSGGSLQGLPSAIRGLFMRGGVGTDIDMCNAHPVILRYICKLHDIPCPHLEYYINHREECLKMFESREIGKITYLTALNKDTLTRAKGLPEEFKKYDVEIKQIQKRLAEITEYNEIAETVPDNKAYNKLGSAINRIMCHYENIILQHAIHVINEKGIEIAILMFDGLMVYGDYYTDKGLLIEITQHVENKMPGLDMKWAYKEHNNELHMPEDGDNITDTKSTLRKKDIEFWGEQSLDQVTSDAIKLLLSNFNPKSPTKVCFTDSVFGEMFKTLYGNKFVYCNDIVYHFNDIYWEADNKKYTNLQRFINTTYMTDLKQWIRSKITYFATKNADLDTEEMSNIDKNLIFWTKLNLYTTEYLQTQRATEQLIKMICSKICNDEQKWDLNPYVFVFTNCVFDLKQGCVTAPNSDDFMTTCCGWVYEFNYKPDDTLLNLINAIQPIEEVRNYLLNAYATGMVGIQNRNIFIFTGTGGNGKSVLDELLFSMLGDYGYPLPKTFLTMPFKEGANPEVINLHNKRAVIVSEPDASKKIVCSSLKAMSGDSKVSSRQLYGKMESVNIIATNFIECNTAPDLDEMNDAMTDRLGEGVIGFHSKYVKQSQWDTSSDEERKGFAGIQNKYYKSDEFKAKYRQALFDMLLPFVDKEPIVPESVVQASRIYLTNSDTFFTWFQSNYEKKEGGIVKIKELWTHYKTTSHEWSKTQKDKYGALGKFERAICESVFLRKFRKDRYDYYNSIQLKVSSLCGWGAKADEEN